MIRLSLLALLLACGSRRDDQPAPSPPPAAPRVVDPPPVERAPRPTTTAPGWASITTIAKGNVRADSLAIDSKGDVVVAVSFKDRITVGDQTFTSDEGVVLVKLAPDGSVRWAKLLGAGRTVEHARIAIDSKDALAIAATMRSSVDLGGGTLASAGEKDILIAKLTADGTHVWSKRYGGGEPDRPADIAVDAKDHIVVGGYYADSVDFGGKKLHSKHDAEMFVARYAPDGKLVFANRSEE